MCSVPWRAVFDDNVIDAQGKQWKCPDAREVLSKVSYV